MPLTSPSAAMHNALGSYLATQIALQTGLGASTCLTRWPEPTSLLQLSTTRVVLAITRAGAPMGDARIGGPVQGRVTAGTLPAGTVRYDFGEVAQRFTLGAWCLTDAIRDDVDEVIHRLLNQPFWTTAPPLVNTTVGTSIVDTGLRLGKQAATANVVAGPNRIYPVSMANIWPGTMLLVDAAGTPETVTVTGISATNFRATFRWPHAANATLVEIAARNTVAEDGLVLRLPNLLNTLARFDFDQPKWMDDAEGGAGSQRQEWQSIRQGIGRCLQLRDVAATLQQRVFVSMQAGTLPPVDDTHPTPVVTAVLGAITSLLPAQITDHLAFAWEGNLGWTTGSPSTWTDQSPSAHVATGGASFPVQTTGPGGLNGLPVVQVTVPSQIMSHGLSLVAPFTLYALVKANSTGAYRTIISANNAWLGATLAAGNLWGLSQGADVQSTHGISGSWTRILAVVRAANDVDLYTGAAAGAWQTKEHVTTGTGFFNQGNLLFADISGDPFGLGYCAQIAAWSNERLAGDIAAIGLGSFNKWGA